MAWSSNTEKGWVVVHGDDVVAGPFKSRKECINKANEFNAPENPWAASLVDAELAKQSKKPAAPLKKPKTFAATMKKLATKKTAKKARK